MREISFQTALDEAVAEEMRRDPRVITLGTDFTGNPIKEFGAARHLVDDDIAKVSLVGAGIKSHPTVVAEMFEALAEEGINIEMITTTSIRISCIIRAEDEERAVRAVHTRFGLGENGEQLRSHD